MSDTIGSFHTAYSTSNQSNATGGGRSGATFFGSCKSTGKVKIDFVEEKKSINAMKELNNVWKILIIILILQIQLGVSILLDRLACRRYILVPKIMDGDGMTMKIPKL